MNETPGQILRMLRESRGYKANRKGFAELTGWSYDICKNLETGRTLVTNQVLDELIEAEWISKGDEWWNRFQTAIKRAALSGSPANNARADSAIVPGYGEEVKKQPGENGKLTWAGLHRIGAEISSLRMASVRGRYDARRYVQREDVRRAFDAFLRSDKRCFVLIGKSGVGKSNFILALADELQQRNDLCLLVYDGAQMKVQPSITETISRDFSYRVRPPDHHIADIWRDIAAIDDIQNRMVLLVVDGINENPQAKELLRQLDDLVQGPPWLRVMFSSRPESWRTIRSGVKLAESLYYRGQEDDGLGVQLEHFTYSEQLQPFSELDLPKAYAKYRAFFGLRTAYEDLDPEIRKMLADPFNLWLVAKTYRGTDEASGKIPGTLRAAELVQEYINDADILRPADYEFLVNDLVPLFAQEAHYRNALSPVDIREAGKRIFSPANGEFQLSGDMRRNQAFENLVNADILTRQGQGANERIAFKYERFYEYFVGKHLFETSRSTTHSEQLYFTLLQELQTRAYVWGVLRTALILEFRAGVTDRISRLCQVNSTDIARETKELLVAALIEYGKDDPDGVNAMLMAALREIKGAVRTRLGALLEGTWHERAALPMNARLTYQVVIEVASALSLTSVLVDAVRQSAPTVRIQGIQYTYYLWKRQPEAAYRILEELSTKVRAWWIIPDLRVIESCVAISLLILCDDVSMPGRSVIQPIWRRILSRLLLAGDTRTDIRGATGRWLRGFLLSTTITLLYQWAKRIESEQREQVMFSIRELEHFFQLDRERKMLCSRLAFCIGADDPDSCAMEDDLIRAARDRDALTAYVMMLVLQSQIVRRQGETLDIIARLLDICLASTPPTPAIVPAINTCANFLLMRRTLDEEVWRVMEIALTRFSTVAHNRGQMSTGVFVWSEESAVLTVSLLSGNDDIPPWINRFLEDAIHRHDLPLIKSFVNRAVGGAISLGTVGPITKFLTPLLDQPEPISRLVADSIANLRMYYPNAVDDALSEIDSSGAFQRLVRDRAPVENLGELLVSHLTRFLGESVMVGATDGRIEWVRDWLASAPNCSNSREWLKSLVTGFANAIYGGRLF